MRTDRGYGSSRISGAHLYDKSHKLKKGKGNTQGQIHDFRRVGVWVAVKY